jgi:hypothetical protein
MTAAPPVAAPTASQHSAVDGHLARLVQRARPAAALLARRQPSMFEQGSAAAPALGTPDGPASAEPIAQPAALHLADSVAGRRTPLQAQEPAVAGPPRPLPPAPLQAPQQMPRHELRVPHETLRIDASVHEVPAVPSLAERASRPAANVPAPEHPAAGRVAAARAADAVPAARPALDPPQLASPAPPPARSGTLAAPPPARPWPATTATEPLLRQERLASTRPSFPPRPAQQAAGARFGQRQQAAPAAAPREPPPVQVTIGRIEVRAVAAPPAAGGRNPAKAAPRLNLEQYLHERHGGRR